MELEELIVLFILKINSIFILKDYRVASDCFDSAAKAVAVITKYYPRLFGEIQGDFNCFYLHCDRPFGSQIKNRAKFQELTCFVACTTTKFYFYKGWIQVLSDIYDEQNRELRCEEIESFKRICLFFRECSIFYNKVIYQVIHLKYCKNAKNPMIHFQADVVKIAIAKVKLILLLDIKDVEKFKRKRKELLKKVPCIRYMRTLDNKRLL
jgi:hypothetical protein